MNCLKEMINMLRQTVQRREKTIQKEKEKHKALVVKNNLLGYRSKELTRLKMKPYISPRSLLLVDSAVYSDFFGYVDTVILETCVSVVNIREFKPNSSCLFRSGNFRNVYKYTLKNGENVVLKRISPNLKFSDEKSVSILSVEARIARLLSHHDNIVDYHGILLHENTCFLIQTFESNYLLKDFFLHKKGMDLMVLSSILRGVCAAITHMHSKGIINNNIRHDNIALRCNSMFYFPVILSLSLSCRADSSKPLTVQQQIRYEESRHLPPRVLNGFEGPSFASDRYGFGFVIGNVIKCIEELNTTVHEDLSILWKKCFKMDRHITIEQFHNCVIDCCNQIEE